MTTSQHPPDADVTRTARLVLTFAVGDVLCDRFRVTRFIARGGMGELYEADDLALGERVALKTIRPEIALDQRAHQRFRREVQLARKITHPRTRHHRGFPAPIPAHARPEVGPCGGAGDRVGVARTLNNLASAIADGDTTCGGALRRRPGDRPRHRRAGSDRAFPQQPRDPAAACRGPACLAHDKSFL
jgi:hypothetical protein